MKKFLALTFSLLLSLSIVTSIVYGGGVETGTDTEVETGTVDVDINLENPFAIEGDLYDLLEAIVNDIMLPIGGVVVVLAFIYSGWLYVTAQGNETKLGNAHKAFLYTSVGAAILLGSWVIANVIRTTINEILP